MEFNRRKVLRPDQRIQIVDQADRHPLSVLLGDLRCFHPGRTVRGTTLLEKEILFHPFGIALQGQCPVFQMGEDKRCDPAVVFQNVGLRETIGRIKVLFKVR